MAKIACFFPLAVTAGHGSIIDHTMIGARIESLRCTGIAIFSIPFVVTNP